MLSRKPTTIRKNRRRQSYYKQTARRCSAPVLNPPMTLPVFKSDSNLAAKFCSTPDPSSSRSLNIDPELRIGVKGPSLVPISRFNECTSLTALKQVWLVSVCLCVLSVPLERTVMGWWCRHTTDEQSVSGRSLPVEGLFHLTTHSTHFIYGYMASDKW